MKKIQLTPKKSLGRVLSLNEMRSIFGGSNATITCMCTMTVIELNDNGIPCAVPKTLEPIGEFHTEILCKAACKRTCDDIGPTCSNPEGHFGFRTGSGSGS